MTDDQREWLIAIIIEHHHRGGARPRELREIGAPDKQLSQQLQHLIAAGIIRRVGHARGTRYLIGRATTPGGG